jgi:opacity protein-like surface antigen
MMTLKRFGLAALALTAVLWTAQSFAAEPTLLWSKDNYTVGKGDLETEFGSATHVYRGDLHSTTFTWLMGANYFVTDIFAPGLSIEVVKAGGTNFKMLPNLKAYWPLHKRFLPYAMIGVGYFHAPGANMFDFAIGPGFDFMLANNVAIGLQFRYDLATGNGTVHDIQFPIGFHIYFKI